MNMVIQQQSQGITLGINHKCNGRGVYLYVWGGGGGGGWWLDGTTGGSQAS